LPSFNPDQTDIAEKVLEAVEALVAENLPVEYEYLPADVKELPCLMVSTIPGNPVEKEYVDGSYIANYRFGLLLRQSAEDSQARLDAIRILRNIADDLCKSPPRLEGVEVWGLNKDNLPSRIATEEPYVDYQVTLTVQYKAHR